MSTRAATTIVAVLALALAPVATAAPDAHVRAHAAFAAAQRAYKAADYKNAATLYEAAYADEPDPAYLFDIAQALRLSNQCAAAADYYHRFLAEVPHPPNLDKVQSYIVEAETCAAALAPHPAPPTPPRPTRTPTPRATPTRPAPGPAPLRTTYGEHDLRSFGIAALTTGVIALGTGAYFTSRVHYWAGQRESICPATGTCTWDPHAAAQASLYDTHGHRFADLSIAAYAIGTSAVVGGALLYLHVAREAPVTVGLAPGGATVTAHFRF